MTPTEPNPVSLAFPVEPLTEEVTAPAPPRGLTAGRALLITLAFYVLQLLVGVVSGLAAIVYQVTAGNGVTQRGVEEATRVVAIPAALGGLLAGGAGVWWLARRSLRAPVETDPFRSIGWSASSRGSLIGAAVFGACVALCYLFVLIPLGPSTVGRTFGPLTLALHAGGWTRHLLALTAVLVAPMVEELVFRGVLFSGLSRSLGTVAAAVVVTLVFVVSHAFEARTYWPAWLAITLMASAAMFLRIRYGSLAPSVAVHTSYNFGLVAVMYLRSG